MNQRHQIAAPFSLLLHRNLGQGVISQSSPSAVYCYIAILTRGIILQKFSRYISLQCTLTSQFRRRRSITQRSSHCSSLQPTLTSFFWPGCSSLNPSHCSPLPLVLPSKLWAVEVILIILPFLRPLHLNFGQGVNSSKVLPLQPNSYFIPPDQMTPHPYINLPL